jgi:hypothetical protein
MTFNFIGELRGSRSLGKSGLRSPRQARRVSHTSVQAEILPGVRLSELAIFPLTARAAFDFPAGAGRFPAGFDRSENFGCLGGALDP